MLEKSLTEVSRMVWRRKGIESNQSGRHFNNPEEIIRCIFGKWMRQTWGVESANLGNSEVAMQFLYSFLGLL